MMSYVVILAMLHRRRVMPQQTERKFPLVLYLRLFAQIRQLVFQVLLFRSRHELQLNLPVAAVGAYCQALFSIGRIVILLVIFLRHHAGQRFLTRRAAAGRLTPRSSRDFDANSLRKASIAGREDWSRSTFRHLRREDVMSISIVSRMMETEPVVIPLLSSVSHVPLRISGKIC